MPDVEYLIIGSGPAGLAAAAFAPPGALVLEARKSPGWKILISANGHCNVTNTFAPRQFLDRLVRGSRGLRTALGAFGPAEIRSWLARLGCPTVVANQCEVYPKSNRAEDVLRVLLGAAASNAAVVLCDSPVSAIVRRAGRFFVDTPHGTASCRRLVVAAGTPAYSRPRPRFDEVLRSLGHHVVPWVPGCCEIPLKDNPFDGLDGISSAAALTVAGKTVGPDEILFTSRGLSGPAAMNASALVLRALFDGAGDDFSLDLLPQQSPARTVRRLLDSRGSRGRKAVPSVLGEMLPRRLAARLAEFSRVADVSSSQFRKPDAERLAALLHAFPCKVSGIPPLARGFVASGGIPLEEINSRTMESKIVPGLFFAGEILDYDAPTGGFNITLALATGRLAGVHLSGGR